MWNIEGDKEHRMATNLQVPPNIKVYEHSNLFDTTVADMVAFHAAPDAFSKLAPPGTFMQVHRRALQSLTNGDVEFTLWLGLIPFRWHAHHELSINDHSFADRQISGPMAYWRHEHIIAPAGDKVRLTDRVTLAHKDGLQGLFTRLMFDGLPLKFLFAYRHWRTRRELAA